MGHDNNAVHVRVVSITNFTSKFTSRALPESSMISNMYGTSSIIYSGEFEFKSVSAASESSLDGATQIFDSSWSSESSFSDSLLGNEHGVMENRVDLS